MAGEFKQFNPDGTNQLSDADWLSSTYRTLGITVGLAPRNAHNKLYYQLSTMVVALADALTAKGATISDVDIAVLTEAIRTSLNSSPVLAITGATTYTYTALNSTILCGGSSNYTVTIPAATDSGIFIGTYLHFINVGTATVLISGGGYTCYIYPGDELKIYAYPAGGSSAWQGQVVRTAANTPGANKVPLYDAAAIIRGAELNMTGAVHATSSTSTITPASAVEVTTGDQILLEGYCELSGSSTFTAVNALLYNDVASPDNASAVVCGGPSIPLVSLGAPHFAGGVDVDTALDAWVHFMATVSITGSGDFKPAIKITKSGGGTVTYEGHLNYYFLKKAAV